MQRSLFGSGLPRFDAHLGPVRRFELQHGAWLEHHPSWLEGHERVFEELRQSAPWIQQRRTMYEREVDVPRLVARAPRAGCPPSTAPDTSLATGSDDRWNRGAAGECMGDLLQALSLALSRRYQRSFESVSLAYYRDGKDSVAFHGDKLGRYAADSVVATVSVGAPRRFLIKPNTGGASLSFDLGWGDLFVMGGTCQRTWQHGVPKRSHADPRISIMFRPQVPVD